MGGSSVPLTISGTITPVGGDIVSYPLTTALTTCDNIPCRKVKVKAHTANGSAVVYVRFDQNLANAITPGTKTSSSGIPLSAGQETDSYDVDNTNLIRLWGSANCDAIVISM